MVEHLQRTVDVDFQCRRDPLRLHFGLGPERGVQISQNRHIFRNRVFKVLLVNNRQAPVDDRLFLRLDAVPASHDQLTEREDEIRLEAQRVVVIGIIQVDVHGIDIIVAGRGDMDHLPAQRMHQRVILAFRIAYDHVILCNKEDIGDLTLGREGFTGTRGSEDQSVRVLQLLPVHHDHVVGKGIQPVIERLALHEQFLCGKRHKDRCGRCGQRPLDRYLIEPQGDAAHQPLFLLVIKPPEYTVVFLRDARCLENHIVQLLAGFRRIQEQHRDQEHPLVTGLQIFQQPLGFISVSHQVRRDDVHVIPRPHRLFLFLDLHPIDIRYFAFH